MSDANNNSVEALVEAVSASLGGLVSMSATYPLDLVKTRMSLEKVKKGGSRPSLLAAAQSLLKEGGVQGLYAGARYKVFQSMLSKFCYYYSVSFLKQTYAQKFGKLSVPVELALGVVAELTHVPLSMPVEVIGSQFQIEAAVHKNKQASSSNGNNNSRSLADVQASVKSAASKAASTWDMVQRIYRTHGWSGFYQGIRPYLCLVALPAIQQTTFERLKDWALTRRSLALGRACTVLSVFEAFWLGAVARAVAVAILYPYTRAKLEIQSSMKQRDDDARLAQAKHVAASVVADFRANSEELQAQAQDVKKREGSNRAPPADLSHMSVHGLLLHLVQRDGVLTLYRGLSADLIRRTASAALMLAVKERIFLITRVVIYFVLRRTAPPPLRR